MVELNSWAETVSKHPLSYVYEGLQGHHTSLAEALIADPDYINNQVEKENQRLYDSLMATLAAHKEPDEYYDEDIHMNYARYLSYKVPASETTKEMVDLLAEMEGSGLGFDKLSRLVSLFEESLDTSTVDNTRSEVIADESEHTRQFSVEVLREEGPTQEQTDEYPVIGVWDHAGGEPVNLDEVLFICGGCGRQPVTWDKAHHCGMCGREIQGRDLDNELDILYLCFDLGMDFMPFATEAVQVQLVTKAFTERVEVYGDYACMLSQLDDKKQCISYQEDEDGEGTLRTILYYDPATYVREVVMDDHARLVREIPYDIPTEPFNGLEAYVCSGTGAWAVECDGFTIFATPDYEECGHIPVQVFASDELVFTCDITGVGTQNDWVRLILWVKDICDKYVEAIPGMKATNSQWYKAKSSSEDIPSGYLIRTAIALRSVSYPRYLHHICALEAAHIAGEDIRSLVRKQEYYEENKDEDTYDRKLNEKLETFANCLGYYP